MDSPFTVERVSSLDAPDLLPYRTLRRPLEHFQKGLFVAEGERVVFRLLASGLVVRSLLLTPSWFAMVSSAYRGRPETPIKVYLAEAALLREIVGYHIHQGIMAVGSVPREPSLDSLPQPHLLVALDGLTQAENVGVIIRSCAGFGVDAVLSGENSSSPYLRRAVRNSMGGVFSLKVIHTGPLNDVLGTLRKKSATRIIAADPHAATTLPEARFTGNVCLVAGNEDTGISASLLDLADQRVGIPMEPGTDSLNVANAVAVFLYEARRQRLGA